MIRSSIHHSFRCPHNTFRLPPALLAAFIIVPALLIAGVDEWVPPALVEKARKDYDRRASERIEDWRRMMADASGQSESQKLETVNRFFNRAIPFRSDARHWKKDDYWASPYEALVTGGGDCEDYVIAKYYSLAKLGVPTERLRITYVKAVELNQAHMVLAYFPQPTAVPLVLDNLIMDIRTADKRRDLDPVYSFNADGMWLDKMKGRAILMGHPNKLDLWTDLRVRMNLLGMDL